MLPRLSCAIPMMGMLIAAAHAEPPQLHQPVACLLQQTCFIQHYVDHDPTGNSRDYMCGTQTYDGHDGTDFRVPSMAVQRAGVDVLAAADGQVERVRDGMRDVSVREIGPEAVKGRECGNAAVIAHADGWQTQYCHLAQGSVRVKPGQFVSAGQPIGRIGESGLAEFPHLHFTVRHGGKVIDPFTYDAPTGSCGGGKSLWAPEVRAAFAYHPGAVLNAGFATGAVTMSSIEAGDTQQARIAPDAPALVAYVRAIGLQAGDVQYLALEGPDGRIVAEHTDRPLDHSKAQVMLYVGKRRPQSGWPVGTYKARYQVERKGAIVIKKTFVMKLKAG